MKSKFEPEPDDMATSDSPNEMETAIKSLELCPASSGLDGRMSELFSQTVPEQPRLPAFESRRRTELLLAVAASLLIGFGTGSWFRGSQLDMGVTSVGLTSKQDAFNDDSVVASNGSKETSANSPGVDEMAVTAGSLSNRPQTRLVSRNTVLSRPLWLKSKEGQVYRSYIAHTKEDLVEVDPSTQKEKAVQRLTPRLVISNAPGI